MFKVFYVADLYKGPDATEGAGDFIMRVGDYPSEEPSDDYPRPPFSSLAKITAGMLSVVTALQSRLLYNVHFVVRGIPTEPSGDPEAVLPAFIVAKGYDARLGQEQIYIRGDTPQPALVAMLRALNAQEAAKDNAGFPSGGIQFAPIDAIPEVKQEN